MARIRQVFPRSEVAHLWANKAQDSARDAGGSFYFTGPVLYSYGSHFVIAAHLDNGRVIWNDASYSNTTAKHKREAWCALSRRQQDTQISVPELTYDGLRELKRLHGKEKNFASSGEWPTVIQACFNSIVARIQSILPMRSADKVRSMIAHAYELQQSAIGLMEYCNIKRKYPLPMIEEIGTGVYSNVVGVKSARAEFVRSFAKSELLKDAETHYAAALENFKALSYKVNYYDAEYRNSAARDLWQDYSLQNLSGSYSHGCVGRIASAIKASAAASDKGKPWAKAVKLSKQIDALREPLREVSDAYSKACAENELRGAVRSAFRRMHAIKTNRRAPAAEFRNGVAARFETLVIQGRDTEFFKEYESTIDRIHRVAAWNEREYLLNRAIEDMESARSYMPTFLKDAYRLFKDAEVRLNTCAGHEKFYSLHAKQIDDMRLEAADQMAQIKASIQAKHESAVEDWKAGRINHLAFDAGMYARMSADGRRVETSRGANVPVEHACRLARLARIAMHKGGQSWGNNDGPMVGHYRVTSIGADGSAVIGCHEFDAAEGMRLLELLESCAACSETVAAVE